MVRTKSARSAQCLVIRNNAPLLCYDTGMKIRRQINPDTLVLLKHIVIGFLVLATVALLITGIWYGTRVKFMTIDEVVVTGGETIDTDKIEKEMQQALEGAYFRLIPRRFVSFYPEKEMMEKLKSVERVHNIKFEIDNRTKLLVTFDEYIPKSLWCGSEDGYECLFIDETGYAFGRAPKLTGGTFLRFVTTGREVKVGETLSEKSVIDNIFLVVTLLADKNWYVSHVELDQAGDVFLGLVGGGELKMVASEDPAKVVDNLLVILASKEFSHLKPGNFQYIDLRFGNKVFVNEEPVGLETSTTSDEIASSTPQN